MSLPVVRRRRRLRATNWLATPPASTSAALRRWPRLRWGWGLLKTLLLRPPRGARCFHGSSGNQSALVGSGLRVSDCPDPTTGTRSRQRLTRRFWRVAVGDTCRWPEPQTAALHNSTRRDTRRQEPCADIRPPKRPHPRRDRGPLGRPPDTLPTRVSVTGKACPTGPHSPPLAGTGLTDPSTHSARNLAE